MIFVLISVHNLFSDCVLISVPSYTHISAHMSHPYLLCLCIYVSPILLVFPHICLTHMRYTYMFVFMFIFRAFLFSRFLFRGFLFSRFYSFPIMQSLLHIIFRRNRNMQHRYRKDVHKEV
jgi:hypothetical protein